MEQEEISPDQLIARAQSGCRDSFEQLVRHFEARVFNYLRQFVGNAHDAQDLTQDTFVKVYKNLHRFKPEYAFSTWLYTIAKRTALNFFRKARPTQDLDPNLRASGPDPAKQVEQKDQASVFWKLTHSLKPKQREALWLRYGEGLSMAEIAEVMDVNEVFVRVTLHRARNQLAKKIQHRSELFPETH